MRRKLGELLVEAGAVTRDDVDAALADQSAGEPSRLGDLLLSTGKCTPNALARALAAQHELSFADLSYVDPEASNLLPLEFQRAHRIVPFRVDRETGSARIHIALADPTLSDLVDELKSQLKREIIVHVAAIDDIESVHLALSGEGSGEGVVMGEVLEDEVVQPAAPEPAFDFPPAPEPVSRYDSPFGAAAEPAAPDLSAFDFPPAPEPAAPDLSAFDFPPAPAPAHAPVEELAPTTEVAVPIDELAFPEPAVTVPAPASGPAPVQPPLSAAEEFVFPDPPAPDASDFGEIPVDLSAEDAPPPIAEPPAPPSVSTTAPAASPSEEDLFGSLDLPAPAEAAPLTTALADEIGRHDLAPPAQDYVGFSALSPPLGDTDDRFGTRASSPVPKPPPSEPKPLVKPEPPLTAAVAPPEVAPPPAEPEAELLIEGEIAAPDAPPPGPAKIPSFAISPDVPVEPRRSPVEPLRRPAALGRIALKKVAVNRAGEQVELPPAAVAPPPPPPPPPPAPEPVVAKADAAERPANELELPEWMRSTTDPAPVVPLLPVPGELSAALTALLGQVERGTLPPGPVLAAVLKLLAEKGVVEDAALTAALEKLK